MEIKIINVELMKDLQQKAADSERLRMNYDLRTSGEDTSQRMLNALLPGTKMPIHRHMKSSETVVCISGCLDWIFYEEVPDIECGRSHDGEKVTVEANFKEVARFRICPRDGQFGIQVPIMAWHSIQVYEPSIIFEAKDGAYAPLGPEEVRLK